MDLQKWVDILDSKYKSYFEIWAKLKKSDKFIISSFIIVGIINILIGILLLCQ